MRGWWRESSTLIRGRHLGCPLSKEPGALFLVSVHPKCPTDLSRRRVSYQILSPFPPLHQLRPLTSTPIMRGWSDSGAWKNSSSTLFTAKKVWLWSAGLGHYFSVLVDTSFWPIPLPFLLETVPPGVSVTSTAAYLIPIFHERLDGFYIGFTKLWERRVWERIVVLESKANGISVSDLILYHTYVSSLPALNLSSSYFTWTLLLLLIVRITCRFIRSLFLPISSIKQDTKHLRRIHVLRCFQNTLGWRLYSVATDINAIVGEGDSRLRFTNAFLRGVEVQDLVRLVISE
jgi:hypothetical protein